jgi:hypothetical protein
MPGAQSSAKKHKHQGPAIGGLFVCCASAQHEHKTRYERRAGKSNGWLGSFFRLNAGNALNRQPEKEMSIVDLPAGPTMQDYANRL